VDQIGDPKVEVYYLRIARFRFNTPLFNPDAHFNDLKKLGKSRRCAELEIPHQHSP
jgi:hypothetical protein